MNRSEEERVRMSEVLRVSASQTAQGRAAVRKQEAKIEKVLRKLPADDVDGLVGEKNDEFSHIAEAIMAWYTMMHAASIFRQEESQKEMVLKTLAASLVILGSIVKYAYALGVRRGRRTAKGAVRKRRGG